MLVRMEVTSENIIELVLKGRKKYKIIGGILREIIGAKEKVKKKAKKKRIKRRETVVECKES